MKALILHGTDAEPNSNWFPWLKSKLEEHGYEVWVPDLPGKHTPSHRVWNDYLLNSSWDVSGGIVIGHSAGAVEVLNLLMDERCPHIKLGVMAGAWAGMKDADIERLKLGGFDPNQFKDTFPPEGFNFELIKSKAERLAFLHGGDDPYCPLEQAQWLAEKLDAEITVVPGGHHLGARFPELPEVWNIIEPSL